MSQFVLLNEGEFFLDSLERNATPLLCDFIESCFQIVRPQYRRLTLARCHNQDVVHGWAVSGTASSCTSTDNTTTSCKDEKRNDGDELEFFFQRWRGIHLVTEWNGTAGN